MSSPLLSGLVAAPFTPFAKDGSVDLSRIEPICDRLAVDGIQAVFICGTTGEGTSLTDSERRLVAESWLKAARGRFKIVVHVGHLSAAASAELAAHSQCIGAAAVATAAPAFGPVSSVSQLVAQVKVAAAGAPKLPCYFYHIPAFTRLEVPMAEFLAEAAKAIPTLRGIKYTHSDFDELLRLLQFDGGRFEILSGREQMLLSALATGAKGAVGSNFNFAAELYRQIWSAFNRGDWAAARGLQLHAAELTRVLRRYGGIRAMKVVMRWRGLDCGDPRPPMLPLRPDEEAALRLDLAAWQTRGGDRNWLDLES